MRNLWSGLTPEEKLSVRLEAWLAAEHIQFVNEQTQKAYRERVQRYIDVIQLRKPDRVPVHATAGFFPAHYAGMTLEEAMYDYNKTAEAWRKFVLEFGPDDNPGTFGPGAGKVFEYLDYRLFRWPGHGVPSNVPFQCIEAEYMKEDEYDDLIIDPSAYLMKTYLARICGKLEVFQNLPSLFNSLEFGTFLGALITLGKPEMQGALSALVKAGNEAYRWAQIAGDSDRKLAELGFPSLFGVGSKAPFDTIGDTLRGTVGIMKDMYRQPNKLLEAIEHITPLMVKWGVSSAKLGNCPTVMLPLHKGANGFMSDAQFKKFYWPSLKAVILGLIQEGLIPWLFAEGGYSSRLEVIKDLPVGKTIWYFDQIDMGIAKTILGKVSCIMGNLPSSLLSTGSPEEVRIACMKLIDIAGKDGGFILSSGSVLESARPENVKTMIETAKSYGKY